MSTEAPNTKETGAFQRLTEAERAEARAIARGCNVRDASAMMFFGVRPQQELTALTDPVLKMVATKDAGEAGKALTSLMSDIKALKADSLAGWIEPPIARLPVVGRWFSVVQQFIAQYERIAVKIDRTTLELGANKDLLAKDITMLDQLYAQNMACYRGLLTHIAAGELKLEDVRAERDGLAIDGPGLDDVLTAQEIADLDQAMMGLDQRVHDLKLAATIALQSGPQIRLVQNSNQALVGKIQSSILLTVPLWKQQVIIAIGLFNQRKAIQLQQAVSKTTNDLLLKNAAMIKQNATAALTESERGIVELETLRKVNQDLIETLEETIRIQRDGQQKRRAVEAELEKLQSDVIERIRNARQPADRKAADVHLPEDPEPPATSAAPGQSPEASVAMDDLHEKLTPREVEVLRLIAQEKSDNQIASELVVSIRTVQAHERSIYGKLGVNNRRDAGKYAKEHKLVRG